MPALCVQIPQVALDLDGSGKLSENEFMKALRDLGLFFGSLPDLWKELQEDGFISFDRFSPDDAKELNAFRAKKALTLS